MIVKFIGGPKDGEECSWPHKEALQIVSNNFMSIMTVDMEVDVNVDVEDEDVMDVIRDKLESSVPAANMKEHVQGILGDKADEFLAKLSAADCHLYFLSAKGEGGLELTFHKTIWGRPTQDNLLETAAKSPFHQEPKP